MIAEKFKVSPAQISCDWKIIVKQLREEATGEIKELIALKLEEYAEVKREMWEAWEKSKANQEERVEEDIANNRGGQTKTSVKERGSCGDPKFIAIIMECLKQESNLQALNPAKEIRGSLTTSINWDVLAQGIPLDGPVPDEVEAEIRKALGYSPEAATPTPANTVITEEGSVPNTTAQGDTIEGNTIYVNPDNSSNSATDKRGYPVEDIEEEDMEDEEE